MKIIKAGFFYFFLLLAFSPAFAMTNSMPQLQALYGGQIRGLNIIRPAGTTNLARMFLKTDFSANSIFYADVNYSLADPYNTNNFSWHVVPDFNAEAGYGVIEGGICAHQASGRLFVAEAFGLLSCTTNAGSLVTNITFGSATFLTVDIHDSVLLSIAARSGSNMLFFGTVSDSGNFAQNPASPINVPLQASSDASVAVNPVSHYVYIINPYGTNGILKSSATYDNLSADTTFSTIDISSVITNWALGMQIGFGPDGRMFIGSKVGFINTIAYSDNDGASWTNVSTGVMGKGCNFDTIGSTAQYNVVIGRAVSTNKGESGSWFALGADDPPGQVRANDSSSKFDPINPQFMYFATDQGVGCTTNGGRNIAAIDFGLEAVAIQGLDMNDAKTLGWTASASGLRRGVGAAGAVQWAVTGTFPLDDGAPYYSVAIDKTDTSGNTVYAGNGYIYKTTDGGTNWTKVYEPATSGQRFFVSIKASGDTVLAGMYDWSSSYNGGLFYSSDGGATWDDIQLEGTNGVNVNKILLMTESGAQVAYVGAMYNTNNNMGGHVYRTTSAGTTHISLGAEHISIRDLAADSSGGIYAAGWNQDYQPLVFYKPADSSEWTQLTTNGLTNMSFYSTGRGPVITVGRDSSSNEVPIVGAGVDLYYLALSASSWTTSSELHYPNGTSLNVLYWDELMVGTTEGLYSQAIGIPDRAVLADPAMVDSAGNWYVWFSGSGYQMGGPWNLGVVGTPAAADFDGDHYTDCAIVDNSGIWRVWFTSQGYQMGGPWSLGVVGTPVAADFDGDWYADPAMVVNGAWYLWLTSLGYQMAGPCSLGVSGTPVAADFDGDWYADPAMVSSAGAWSIWFTSQGYQMAGPWSLGVSGLPVAADYDGDAYADPAMVDSAGAWRVWYTSLGYQMGGPYSLGVSGTPVPADFDGR